MVSKENLKPGDFVWHTLQHTWAKVHRVLDTLVEIYIGYRNTVELAALNHLNFIYNTFSEGDYVLYNGEKHKIFTLAAPYFVGDKTAIGLLNPKTGLTLFTGYDQVEKLHDIISVEEYCDSIFDTAPESERRALDKQVGGGHYKKFPIQPLEFITRNNLSFCQGNVIKYVCRYPKKNGIEDLRKARDYIDKMIAFEGEENV